ncbi:hypothetical protein PoB_003142500 [Plakobranchus ocellatus]|uniref:Uncharacterized protein n=1 Tax=Plakobranchus ocellatus TaxID=259542 RepID=A0AAV4ADS6_9GAST|nr:hypothetical protein PoB_003142500 [Plakobranchus ocellatus]
MHIPTSFLESEPDKTACVIIDGNETRWEGFNVAVMNLLSEALGFTGIPFATADGGFYDLSGPNEDTQGVAVLSEVTGGVGGMVDSHSALKSAGSTLSLARASPLALWPDGGL